MSNEHAIDHEAEARRRSLPARLSRYLPEDRMADAMQLVDDSGLEKLEMFASEIARIGELATANPLESDADEGKACELISRGGIALKELEALRRKIVDPMNERVRAVNAVFKVVTEPCGALVGKGGRLERLVLAYRAEKRARREREEAEARRRREAAALAEAEALAKAEAAKSAKAREAALREAEAASKAQTEAQLAAPPPMTKGVRTDSGSVSERQRYVVLEFDPDKVPPAYWRHADVLEALRKVLQRAVTAGAREIPGVAIGIEEGLTRRPGL